MRKKGYICRALSKGSVGKKGHAEFTNISILLCHVALNSVNFLIFA